MAIADPQSITIDGNTTSLPRVGTSPTGSTYRSADGNIEVTISHNYAKRNRHLIKVTHKKVIGDPLVTGVNVPVSASFNFVVDTPPDGSYTAEELGDIFAGFGTQMASGSPTLFTRVLSGES